MLELRSTDVLEAIKRSQQVSSEPAQQPRGFAVPVAPPAPAELMNTPGADDAADRVAYRARLIEAIHVQQEALPVVAARGAFHGLLAGTMAGVGLLALRAFWGRRR